MRRTPYNIIGRGGVGAYDVLTDAPSPGFWSKWFTGLIAPVLLGLVAVSFILTESAVRPYIWGGSSRFSGTAAVWTGVSVLGLACFLHCRYLWSHVRGLRRLATAGQVVGALVCFGGIMYSVWSDLFIP